MSIAGPFLADGILPDETVGRPSFTVATPGFLPSGYFKERSLPPEGVVGKRGTGPSLSSFSMWRGLPCPASVLPSTGAPASRGEAPPLGAAFHGQHAAPVSRAGLGGSSPSGAPLRHQPGTGASLRYPVRTEFPWKRTGRISEAGRAGMKSSRSNEFNSLAEKSRKSIHGVRFCAYGLRSTSCAAAARRCHGIDPRVSATSLRSCFALCRRMLKACWQIANVDSWLKSLPTSSSGLTRGSMP